MKTRHYIAVVLFVLLLILFRFVAEIGDRSPGMYIVTSVIDGDTAELNRREKLRLLDIDTPEHGQPFAEKATEYLAELILNKEIRLIFDHRKRDKYDRLLAYVYIDSVCVNAALLAKGYAWLYLHPDQIVNDSMTRKLLAVQHRAIDDNVGVWALPVAPEEYYVGNSARMRFHRPDCNGAQKLPDDHRVIFETRTDAFYQGYSPCRNCKP